MTVGTAGATAPDLVAGTSGGLAAVWLRDTGAGTSVQVAEERGDGSWGPAATLSSAGLVTSPALALAGAGGAVAAWIDEAATPAVEVSARRSTGAVWSPPVELAATAVSPPSVALAANGDALVAWSALATDGVPAVSVALRSGWTGAWKTTTLSAPGGDAIEPRAAIADTGAAVVVWHRFDGTADVAQAAFRPAGAGWLAAVDLDRQGDAVTPDVALDAKGNAVVAWGNRDQDGRLEVRAATRPLSGPWSAPITLAASQDIPGVTVVAVDQEGNATVAWESLRSLRPAVRVAYRPAGGAFGSPLDVTSPGSLAGPPDAAAASGTAAVAWTSFGAPSAIQALTLRAGAGDAAELLASPEQSEASAVAVASDGTPLVAWIDAAGSQGLLRVAARDDVAPTVDSLVAPGRIGIGQTAAFSVGARDRWSGVGEPVWELGDGTILRGRTIEHVYATPGTYEVRVTVTDGAGNGTRLDHSIAVSLEPVRDLTPPRLRLTPREFRVGPSRRLPVTITCPATETSCRGTLRVVLPLPPGAWRKGSLDNPSRPRPLGENRYLIAASRRFRLAGGETAKLALRLTLRGMRLVTATKTLHGELVAVVVDGAGNARSQAHRITLRV